MGNMIIPIIGYVVAILSPIIGLVYGAVLFFFKKDDEEYRKHGRFIIYFAIVMFIVGFIVRMVLIH